MSCCADKCDDGSGKYSPEIPKESSPVTGFETQTETGHQSGGKVIDKASEGGETPHTCSCNPCNCNPCKC